MTTLNYNDDVKGASNDYLTPAELRWMMSKRQPGEGDYDLLMRCLGSMDHNLKEIERLRAALKTIEGQTPRILWHVEGAGVEEMQRSCDFIYNTAKEALRE
jgi:hypothetical protein